MFSLTHNLNRDQLSKQFLQRCKDNYLKSLYYSDSNKIDNYPALKESSDNYQFQTYLEKIKIVEHLTRLRTGCTDLSINTEKTPKNDRKCPLCKQGIEDSSHVLFQCLKKTNIRAKLQDTLNGCKTHLQIWIFRCYTKDNYECRFQDLDKTTLFHLYKERKQMGKSQK